PGSCCQSLAWMRSVRTCVRGNRRSRPEAVRCSSIAATTHAGGSKRGRRRLFWPNPALKPTAAAILVLWSSLSLSVAAADRQREDRDSLSRTMLQQTAPFPLPLGLTARYD